MATTWVTHKARTTAHQSIELIAMLIVFMVVNLSCESDAPNTESTSGAQVSTQVSDDSPDDSTAGSQSSMNEEVTSPRPSDTMGTGDEASGDYIENDGFVLEKSHAVVFREFTFFGADEEGRLEGFIIDDVVSDDQDASTCHHPDSVDRNGREGVDNQFGVIWSNVLEPLVGEAAHALLNGAVNEGRMLFAVELTGVDDLEDDDDVQLHFFRARGSPFVGTQGLLAPDQSYYINSETPGTIVEGVSIKDREIQVGPVAFEFPVDILAEFFLISIKQGQLRIRFNEDGSAEGLIGGVIDVQSFLEAGYQTNAEREFRVVTPLVMRSTDMMLNDEGECEGISIAIKFSATTGFVIHYDEDDLPSEQ